jgi:hypothetical protein
MAAPNAPTNTGTYYTFSTPPANIIREDLSDYVYKISPLETPALQAIGRKGKWRSVLHEWPIVELAAANAANAKIEGGDVDADAPTTPMRRSNYSQIMTKTKRVSSTDEAIIGAGDVQRMAKQVLYGTQELKRDIEARLVGSGALVASPGSTSTARTTASISSFIMTNALRGATGANNTLSIANGGYPSGVETVGTARALTEPLTVPSSSFKNAIQLAWTAGGNPDLVLVPPPLKVSISAFTGNSTRFKKAEDKRLVAAIDVYESDFGEVQVVPDRFMDNTTTTPFMRVLIIDRELLEIGWLQSMKNEPLAKTGLSDARLISCEWGTVVGNEKGLAQITDLNA